MRKYVLFLLLLFCVGYGCQRPKVRIDQTESIPIDASLDSIQDTAYLAFLAPHMAMLDELGHSVIAYANQPLTFSEPEGTMLNWAADALLAQARKYYPGRVDVAVVNKGGLRTEWQAGDISVRNVYELMPFNNELVVLTLQGQYLLELCQVFVEDNGQGIANMTVIGEDNQLAEALVGGQPVDPEAFYTVATSNYLAGGTDHMTPLTHSIETWPSGKFIRDLYIDEAKQQQTLTPSLDHRFIINNQ